MVSIIVPVYNEEATIERLVSSFSYNGSFEIIVADGGSQDRTRELIRQYPVKLLQCIKGRACQMNDGAGQAKGDILVFLHADCLLEKGSLETIRESLEDGYVGGCLSQRINSHKIIYRFIEVSGNIRALLFKIFYGDQAIFVRRDIFLKVGGFDNVPLFEDILFSKKMAKEGKICVLNKKVLVSPRRWQKNGIIMTTIIFWLLSLGLSLGFSFDRLKRLYQDIR